MLPDRLADFPPSDRPVIPYVSATLRVLGTIDGEGEVDNSCAPTCLPPSLLRHIYCATTSFAKIRSSGRLRQFGPMSMATLRSDGCLRELLLIVSGSDVFLEVEASSPYDLSLRTIREMLYDAGFLTSRESTGLWIGRTWRGL